MLSDFMLAYPTVFAVGNKYNIFVPFSDSVIMWVKVGDKIYYDHSNGVLRSNTGMHKVELPMNVLDEAKAYTVVYKKMIERAPYFPKSEPEITFTVPFKPVQGAKPLNIYHIADAHSLVKEPVSAGRFFGEDIDLLVLNGDIPDHSVEVEAFNKIYEIASGITKGQCPTVFARGNHDTRGACAENMSDYIPTSNGKTYYTFRVGPIWGLVLDCGEDKNDTHAEYGGTVCFHSFREEETEHLKSVVANAKNEYAAEGVEYKLVISHIAFTHICKPPFDIEKEIYGEWARIMREDVRPDLLLYGHHHITDISLPGSAFDDFGQACVAIIGSKPIFDKETGNDFIGCGITMNTDGTKRIIFNDSNGNVLRDETV